MCAIVGEYSPVQPLDAPTIWPIHAQVDAFTSKAFGGNSAAIIFLEWEARSISTETLQLLAMENNLSETAYIQTIDPSESVASASNFGLRWFTPTTEAKLCGHATLASAAAIWKCEMPTLLERVGGTLVHAGY